MLTTSHTNKLGLILIRKVDRALMQRQIRLWDKLLLDDERILDYLGQHILLELLDLLLNLFIFVLDLES